MNTIGYSHKNYLCSLNGYDLVEQFLEHYFSSYDCIGRPNMRRKCERITLNPQLVPAFHVHNSRGMSCM